MGSSSSDRCDEHGNNGSWESKLTELKRESRDSRRYGTQGRTMDFSTIIVSGTEGE